MITQAPKNELEADETAPEFPIARKEESETPETKVQLDELLDEALEELFPASDPMSSEDFR